jgi:hypothetical protein
VCKFTSDVTYTTGSKDINSLEADDEEDANELENDFADEKVCSTLLPLFVPVE